MLQIHAACGIHHSWLPRWLAGHTGKFCRTNHTKNEAISMTRPGKVYNLSSCGFEVLHVKRKSRGFKYSSQSSIGQSFSTCGRPLQLSASSCSFLSEFCKPQTEGDQKWKSSQAISRVAGPEFHFFWLLQLKICANYVRQSSVDPKRVVGSKLRDSK